MSAPVVLLVLTLAVLVVVSFTLGVFVGSEDGETEAARVRLEAAQAERRLHDLTQCALEAMTEEAQRLRGRGQ